MTSIMIFFANEFLKNAKATVVFKSMFYGPSPESRCLRRFYVGPRELGVQDPVLESEFLPERPYPGNV